MANSNAAKSAALSAMRRLTTPASQAAPTATSSQQKFDQEFRTGKVDHVDSDGTAWVQLVGDDGPSPCDVSATCAEGDVVYVRVTPTGRACVTENRTDPAATVRYMEDAIEAAIETAQGITLVRAYGDGVLVGRVGQSPCALVNADGSFDVVDVTWSGETPTVGYQIATFGSIVDIGGSYNNHVTIDGDKASIGDPDSFHIDIDGDEMKLLVDSLEMMRFSTSSQSPDFVQGRIESDGWLTVGAYEGRQIEAVFDPYSQTSGSLSILERPSDWSDETEILALNNEGASVYVPTSVPSLDVGDGGVTVANGGDVVVVDGYQEISLKNHFHQYDDLRNRPSIEGVTLSGDKSFPDLTIFLDPDLDPTGREEQEYPRSDDYALTTEEINALWNM